MKWKIGVTILFVFVLLVTTNNFLINQEKTYHTSLGCQELRECVFGIIKWSFDDKSLLSVQKEYYTEKCMEYKIIE